MGDYTRSRARGRVREVGVNFVMVRAVARRA
jgi:hypothetical protein